MARTPNSQRRHSRTSRPKPRIGTGVEWMGVMDRVSATTRGMTIREVARITGCNHETLRRYLTFISEPGVTFVLRFIQSFDVDPAWLLTGRRPTRSTRARR